MINLYLRRKMRIGGIIFCLRSSLRGAVFTGVGRESRSLTHTRFFFLSLSSFFSLFFYRFLLFCVIMHAFAASRLLNNRRRGKNLFDCVKTYVHHIRSSDSLSVSLFLSLSLFPVSLVLLIVLFFISFSLISFFMLIQIPVLLLFSFRTARSNRV